MSSAQPNLKFCALALALVLGSRPALADLMEAAPLTPIVATFPAGAPQIEVQVVLSLVIDQTGHVESAVVSARVPADAPSLFGDAALAAVRGITFRPSERDGHAIVSRIEYTLVLRPPAEAEPTTPPTASDAPEAASASPAAPSAGSPAAAGLRGGGEQDEDERITIEVHGASAASLRGVGDFRVKRELLDAAPHAQASEMLSAAPGFFVDHEDGEGLGNDIFLRGFDLEHGSGIELRVGNVPINSPLHVQGQGYADANFIIPEVVRSIRVLEGSYDPRQGDAAIAGSAYFDLGASARGNELKGSYGSFGQARIVGIAAPAGFDEQTFVAFALRHSDGFGVRRASDSGTLNAQYGLDLGSDSHLRLFAAAYGARSQTPGVLRAADVAPGALDYYGRYPDYADQQGVQSSRVLLSADVDTVTRGGDHFEFVPWVTWTNFDSRANYTGNLLSSVLDPQAATMQGDLWEAVNRESAAGALSRLHSAPLALSSFAELSIEPGVGLRVGHSEQRRSLISPSTLSAWDRRLDVRLDTLDASGYLDVALRLFRRFRLSGGVRADSLSVTVDDRLGYDVPAAALAPGTLPGATRAAQGLAWSPRATAEIDVLPELTAVASYGEGLRSRQASSAAASSAGIAGAEATLRDGDKPFSKTRSGEAGFRAKLAAERLTLSCSLFETHVDSELAFEASSGGFEEQGASVRRGVVAAAVVKPSAWLTASAASSVVSATYTAPEPGDSRYVPNVPPVLVRVDATAHGTLAHVDGRPFAGRLGLGYTFLGGRHVTDNWVGPADHVLNGLMSVRYAQVELGFEGYNLLARKYADDREYYASNWSARGGSAPASPAVHQSAAPPLTLIGTLAVFF